MSPSPAALAFTAGAAVFAASIYLHAQAQVAGAASAQQVLQRYCISCHNARLKTASATIAEALAMPARFPCEVTRANKRDSSALALK